MSNNCHSCCSLHKIPYVDELVKSYLRIGFSNKEMNSLLAHNMVRSVKMLKRWCKKRQTNKLGRVGWIYAK